MTPSRPGGRGPAAATVSKDGPMNDRDRRIALLIDADNAPAAKIDLILAEVARHGTANVRRAYGNWKSPHLKSWEAVLHTHAIRPIQQFAYSVGKNASDMAMVVDAMDLLYARNLDAFAVVSSDADFTPLVMRILTDGLKVYGFGERKTPDAFVNACSQFTYVEGLREPGPAVEEGPDTGGGTQLAPVPADRLREDKRLVRMIGAAVDAAGADEGWANLSAVGSQIGNQASLDPRNYGYRKLSDLVEATGLFEIRRDGASVLLRRRGSTVAPAKKVAAKKAQPEKAPAQKTQKAQVAKTQPKKASTKKASAPGTR
jgi:uncharacterized protein (TIGR00288 family)